MSAKYVIKSAIVALVFTGVSFQSHAESEVEELSPKLRALLKKEMVALEDVHSSENGDLSINPDQYFADWTLTAYGKTPTAFLQSDEEAVNLAAVVALRDAGANFATSFTRVPDIATWMTEGVQPLSSEATENKGASDE